MAKESGAKLYQLGGFTLEKLQVQELGKWLIATLPTWERNQKALESPRGKDERAQKECWVSVLETVRKEISYCCFISFREILQIFLYMKGL